MSSQIVSLANVGVFTNMSTIWLNIIVFVKILSLADMSSFVGENTNKGRALLEESTLYILLPPNVIRSHQRW